MKSFFAVFDFQSHAEIILMKNTIDQILSTMHFTDVICETTGDAKNSVIITFFNMAKFDG